MPLRDMIENMQGLSTLAKMNQERTDKQKQLTDDKEANSYLQKYLQSEQEGNPDYNSLHQATLRSPALSQNALASLGIQKKQQGVDASNFLIQNYGIADNPQQFIPNAQARIEYLTRNGRDAKDTQALLDQYQSGDITGAKNNMRLAAAALANQKFIEPGVADDVFGFNIARGGKAHANFGAQVQFKDEKGNLFFGTGVGDPNTASYRSALASVDGSNTKPVGQLSIVGNYGQTASEKVNSAVDQAVREKTGTQNVIAQTQPGIEGNIAKSKTQTTQSLDLADKFYQRLTPINNTLASYDEALRALDSGANTGKIESLLPTFTQASIDLENVRRNLGLNVIQNTTFGALSKGEMDFALDNALPVSKDPESLKVWLREKKAAQTKMRNYLENAIQYLGDGHTISELSKMQAQQRDNAPDDAEYEALKRKHLGAD